jgi:UrcA family protein
MNASLIKEANMNPRLTLSFISAAFLALAATALGIKTQPAVAQQASEETEELVIEAPIVRRQVGRAVIGAARVEVIELTRQVSYADLDLSKDADVTELETRIETTAKDSCEKISDMFPSNRSDRAEIARCANQAIDGTEEQVQAAIVAAN